MKKTRFWIVFYFFVFYNKKRVFYDKKRLVFYTRTTLVMEVLITVQYIITSSQIEGPRHEAINALRRARCCVSKTELNHHLQHSKSSLKQCAL